MITKLEAEAEIAALELVWQHYNEAESHYLEEARMARVAMDLAQNRIDELEEIIK